MAAFKKWDKTEIQTDSGEVVEGIAPIIISASRSTDIPAFHAEWFINRLNCGYIKWINPFNRTSQYVSFEKTRAIVFWTKNAAPMIPFLDKVDEKNINYYFQFTLNDYDDEGFEPSVPKLDERIKTFKQLSDRIGKDRVIWRFDPLILSDQISVEKLLDKIYYVGNKIHKYTDKLVISFADIESYSKVKKNLIKADVKYVDFDENSMEQIAKGIQKINDEWGLEISMCAENINFDKYNIKNNRCIDDKLMIQAFRNDDDLMRFLGIENENKSKNTDLSLFGGGSGPITKKRINLKDKGQRKQCGCIVSKDIGQYNTCGHLCVYCYANYSENVVRKNIAEIRNKNGESILGI